MNRNRDVPSFSVRHMQRCNWERFPELINKTHSPRYCEGVETPGLRFCPPYDTPPPCNPEILIRQGRSRRARTLRLGRRFRGNFGANCWNPPGEGCRKLTDADNAQRRLCGWRNARLFRLGIATCHVAAGATNNKAFIVGSGCAGVRLETYPFVVLRGVAYNARILQLCVDQGCGITRLAPWNIPSLTKYEIHLKCWQATL